MKWLFWLKMKMCICKSSAKKSQWTCPMFPSIYTSDSHLFAKHPHKVCAEIGIPPYLQNKTQLQLSLQAEDKQPGLVWKRTLLAVKHPNWASLTKSLKVPWRGGRNQADGAIGETHELGYPTDCKVRLLSSKERLLSSLGVTDTLPQASRFGYCILKKLIQTDKLVVKKAEKGDLVNGKRLEEIAGRSAPSNSSFRSWI